MCPELEWDLISLASQTLRVKPFNAATRPEGGGAAVRPKKYLTYKSVAVLAHRLGSR